MVGHVDADEAIYPSKYMYNVFHPRICKHGSRFSSSRLTTTAAYPVGGM